MVRNALMEATPRPSFGDYTEISNRDAQALLKELIPEGNKWLKNTPYKAIKQLVLYFSPNGARKHGGAATREIVEFMLKDRAISRVIKEITQLDYKIHFMVYESRELRGRYLVQEVIYQLIGMREALIKFDQALTNSNFTNYFQDSEAVKGSPDGRRIGLQQIAINAFKGIAELTQELEHMQNAMTGSGRY